MAYEYKENYILEEKNIVLKKVVKTKGDGSKNNPVRNITQYFNEQKELIFQLDPFVDNEMISSASNTLNSEEMKYPKD